MWKQNVIMRANKHSLYSYDDALMLQAITRFLHWHTVYNYAKSMDQTPSLEADSRSVAQEIFRPFWNQKAYYYVHKSRPVASLRQMNPDRTLPSYLLKTHLILSLHLYPSLPSISFFHLFQPKIYTYFSSSPRVLYAFSILFSLISSSL